MTYFRMNKALTVSWIRQRENLSLYAIQLIDRVTRAFEDPSVSMFDLDSGDIRDCRLLGWMV